MSQHSAIDLSIFRDRRGRLCATVTTSQGTSKPVLLDTLEERAARELVGSVAGIAGRRWLEEPCMSCAELAEASAEVVAKLKGGASG